jgi:hypothetical protein
MTIMKKLLIVALLLPVFCFGQKKGDNTIILKKSDITFNDLTKELAGMGYEIDYINESVGQIGTKFARVKNFDFSSRLKIQYSSDSISVQGVLRMDTNVSGVWSKEQEDIVQFVGPAKSAHKHTFNQISNSFKIVANKYTGDISYYKK